MSWSDCKNGRYAVVVEQSLESKLDKTCFKMCVVAETVECCGYVGRRYEHVLCMKCLLKDKVHSFPEVHQHHRSLFS